MFVSVKEKDPYFVDSLPTCGHASTVCEKKPECSTMYNNFKNSCKIREGKCGSENRTSCHEAWRDIHFTPMFGCICNNLSLKTRCGRVYNSVNENPCIGSSMKYEEEDAMNFRSTCAEALEMCTSNADCKKSLDPVLQHCNISRCRKQQCMDALQNFYRSNNHLKWSVEIAFCLCKKTSDSQEGACLAAQETLHPVCAQQNEGSAISTCHSLAEKCKGDPDCRLRLEQFEQACAVDYVTKECTGPPADCRIAMLGILGTVLRSNCACKGTDFSRLYECLGWQRVLWFNPCVVQAQRDFHAMKMRGDVIEHTTALRTLPSFNTKHTETTTPSTTLTTLRTTQTTTTPRTTTTPKTTTSTTATPTTTTTEKITPLPAATTSMQTKSTAPLEPVQTTGVPTVHTSPVTTTAQPTHSELERLMLVSTTTDAHASLVSTLPPRYCVVQRPHQKDQTIPEGEGKRLYKDSEPDCSQVCLCTEGEMLVCNTVCVQTTPCQTDFAFYNHAAPAYQAFRGSCLCYSGRFICMRPSPDAYKLIPGVYIFLGYSQADEELLKPIIGMEIRDAVAALQTYLKSLNPKANCVLSIYSMTMENVVLIAKIVDSNSSLIRSQKQRQNANLLQQEKKECAEPLQDISVKINSRDSSIHSHVLLSMFKISEVEVIVPQTSEAAAVFSLNLQLNYLILSIFLFFYSYSVHDT